MKHPQAKAKGWLLLRSKNVVKSKSVKFDFEYFNIANRDTVIKLTSMTMMASFLSFVQALSKHRN